MLLVNKFLFLNKFKNIFMSVFVRKYINMEKKNENCQTKYYKFFEQFYNFLIQ